MKTFLKKFLPIYIIENIRKSREQKQLREWERSGKPVPPPHIVKQLAIIHYKEKHNISILVETGTYLGDMVNAQLKNFTTIYSIELGNELWEQAVKRFNKYRHVNIIQGDSGKILVNLIPRINDKAIFWLDGHYSAGNTAKGDKNCPIYEELDSIFNSKFQNVLLIDDARCFNGENDYPTLNELSEYILTRYCKSNIEIKDDIIRIELN